MSGFSSVSNMVDQELGGAFQVSSFRKVPATASTAGTWVDLSMTTGNPKPNYYVGAELESTILSSQNGIYHGQNVSPGTKILKEFVIQTPTATAVGRYYLLDYVMFYPLIDMDVTDPQDLVNSTPLPRYTDGQGVKAMLVATNPYIGAQTYTISYTNQAGVSGRTSVAAVSNTGTNIGTLISGSSAVVNSVGPFIPLQSGDTGIQSVQSITFSGSNGGLAALVLVKPLASTFIREITAPNERNFLFDLPQMPIVKDGAYLNMICNPTGSLASAVITGLATFIWSV